MVHVHGPVLLAAIIGKELARQGCYKKLCRYEALKRLLIHHFIASVQTLISTVDFASFRISVRGAGSVTFVLYKIWRQQHNLC